MLKLKHSEEMETLKQKAFSLFYHKEHDEPRLQNPFEQNGKFYATDRYVLIRCDSIDFEFKNEYVAPTVEPLIPKPNRRELIDFRQVDFEKYKTIDELSKVGEDVICSDCNGDGEVEWEYEGYTREFECPVCDGSGYSSECKYLPTGVKIVGNATIKLYDALLDIKYFYKLKELQELTGCDVYLVNYTFPTKAILFSCGEFEVIIMPLTYNGDNDIILVNTTVLTH